MDKSESNMDIHENFGNDNMDYTKLVIEDMYEILSTTDNPWPKKFTRLKKLEFLDKMLNYLKEHEMFEMCRGVEKMKEVIINESIHKSKRDK